MKKLFFLIAVILITVSCSKVPSGYVGVKVYLLGGSKGVESEELKIGRYWIGFNEELHLFPTFKQNYVWTKDAKEGSENDESITFQTKEGLAVNADIGITYSIEPTKVNTLFQKYRKGIEEITDKFMRNRVRDAFNVLASGFKVESVYGSGKSELLRQVNEKVRMELKKEGILVERIYAVGTFRLPPQVTASLNRKIEAIQKSAQKEYELRMAQAEAKISITKAKADAQVIALKQRSITDRLIRYEAVQKWDGKLPTTNASKSIPFLNIK